MYGIDLGAHAETAIARAKAMGVEPEDWEIRVRETNQETGKKETVERSQAPAELATLVEAWHEIIDRRAAEGEASLTHIECIGVGKRSPFMAFTVRLRDADDHIEPGPDGANNALASMGLGTNRLLMRMNEKLLDSLLKSRETETAHAVAIAEATAKAEANDDTAKWQAFASAAHDLGPAAMGLVQILYQQHQAAQDAQGAAGPPPSPTPEPGPTGDA